VDNVTTLNTELTEIAENMFTTDRTGGVARLAAGEAGRGANQKRLDHKNRRLAWSAFVIEVLLIRLSAERTSRSFQELCGLCALCGDRLISIRYV